MKKNDEARLSTEIATCEPELTDCINDIELSRRMAIARITLQTWRSKGEGPPFYRFGRRVVYKWSEVQEWMREHRVG